MLRYGGGRNDLQLPSFIRIANTKCPLLPFTENTTEKEVKHSQFTKNKPIFLSPRHK